MQSLPVAMTAVVWMAFVTVVFMFPLTPNPSAGNMNYTVVVQGKDVLFLCSFTDQLVIRWRLDFGNHLLLLSEVRREVLVQRTCLYN